MSAPKPPINLILERNIERLLKQSYEPVHLRPEFSEELRTRFVARARYLARARDGANHPQQASRSASLGSGWLTAALLLLLAGSVVWFSQLPSKSEAPQELAEFSLESILESGRTAFRRSPKDAWIAAESSLLDGPEKSQAYLAVRTPQEAVDGQASITVRLPQLNGPEGQAEFGSDSAATLSWRTEGLELDWQKGELTLTHAGASPLRLLSVDGELEVLTGQLELGRREEERGRPLRLASGTRARLAGSTDPLPVELALYWKDGRCSSPESEEESAPERTAIQDPEPTKQEPETGLAALSLRITRASDGEPVRGARVWTRKIVPLPDVSMASVHEETDPEGRLDIRLAPTDTFVLVEASGFAAWRRERVELDAATPTHIEVALEPGGSATGFVVDKQTGAPIPGARVFAELDQPHQVLPFSEDNLMLAIPFLANVQTDAAGAFRFEHLSVGRHVLRVDHPGYGAAWSPKFQVEPSEELELKPLALGAPALLRGRVERQDGSPYGGAILIASRLDMSGSTLAMSFGEALTASDGSYSIPNLAPGFYIVLLINEEGGVSRAPERMQQLRLQAGEERQLDFLGQDRRHRIAGRVLDPSGKRLVDTSITLVPDPKTGAYSDWSAAITGPEGEFEFLDVASGSYGLFLGRELGVHMSLVYEFEVAPSQPADNLELRLPETRVSGIVVGPNREPIVRAALVVLRCNDEGVPDHFAGRMETDGEGRFTMTDLLPGRYSIGAYEPDGLLAGTQSDTFQLFPGEPQELEIVMPMGGQIAVRVVDEQGRPVPGVAVDVRDSRGRPGRARSVPSTDSNGRFSTPGLATGAWRVELTHPSYPSLVRPAEVHRGETTELEVTLRGKRR